MSKILAIDYGLKRIGIAISDENRILAFALETISSSEIFSYLNQITIKENIDVFVIGKPIQKDNTPVATMAQVVFFCLAFLFFCLTEIDRKRSKETQRSNNKIKNKYLKRKHT